MTRKRYVKVLMGKGLPRNTAVDFTKCLRFWHIPYKRCDVNFVQRRSDNLFHMECTIPIRYASNVFFYNRTLKENNIWLPNEEEVVFYINRAEFNNQNWYDSPLRRWCEDNIRPSIESLLQMCCKDGEQFE